MGGFATYQKGNYTGPSHFAELFSNLQFGKGLELLAGVDYRKNATDQNYSSISFFGPYISPALSADTAKTNQLSGYASLVAKNIQGFNIELGGRWNNHSLYGNNFTYSFNPFYVLHKKYKWFANISSGYKVPSLYQLYAEFGNKNLQPEVSTSLDGGLQYLSDKINGQFVVFKRNIKNVFYFYTDPVTFQSLYVNEDKQKDWGIETELALQISDELSLNTNYTFVDGRIYTLNLAAKDTGYNNLYKRPAHTFNFSIGYQPLQKLYISAHIKGVSKFYEAQYAAPDFVLKGYYTLDFYSEYQFNKKGKIFADLQNITDQKYFDQKGFTTKRFNFNAGLNINL
jgi:vitamin B12 transporter